MKKLLVILALLAGLNARAINVPHSTTNTATPTESVSTQQVLWLTNQAGTRVGQASMDADGNLRVTNGSSGGAAQAVTVISSTALTITAFTGPAATYYDDLTTAAVSGYVMDQTGILRAIQTFAVTATLVSPTGGAIAVAAVPGFHIRLLGYSWTVSTTSNTPVTVNGGMGSTALGFLSALVFGLAAVGEQAPFPSYIFQTNVNDDLTFAQFQGTQTVKMYAFGQYVLIP